MTYYIRSYAINDFGLYQSGTSSLYVNIEEPELETGGVGEVSYYEALLKGNLVVKGSEDILSYGHCSSTEEPTITRIVILTWEHLSTPVNLRHGLPHCLSIHYIITVPMLKLQKVFITEG